MQRGGAMVRARVGRLSADARGEKGKGEKESKPTIVFHVYSPGRGRYTKDGRQGNRRFDRPGRIPEDVVDPGNAGRGRERLAEDLSGFFVSGLPPALVRLVHLLLRDLDAGGRAKLADLRHDAFGVLARAGRLPRRRAVHPVLVDRGRRRGPLRPAKDPALLPVRPAHERVRSGRARLVSPGSRLAHPPALFPDGRRAILRRPGLPGARSHARRQGGRSQRRLAPIDPVQSREGRGAGSRRDGVPEVRGARLFRPERALVLRRDRGAAPDRQPIRAPAGKASARGAKPPGEPFLHPEHAGDDGSHSAGLRGELPGVSRC